MLYDGGVVNIIEIELVEPFTNDIRNSGSNNIDISVHKFIFTVISHIEEGSILTSRTLPTERHFLKSYVTKLYNILILTNNLRVR